MNKCIIILLIWPRRTIVGMVLIEMQCKGWEHNRVNAGIMVLCHKSFPNEHIKFYAEEEHIRELSTLIDGGDHYLTFAEINFGDWRTDCIKCCDNYAELLSSIMEETPGEKNVVLLSCNKGIVKAISNICKKYVNRNFYLIMHAALEEVMRVNRLGMRTRVEDILFGVKNILKGRKTEYIPMMRDCINECYSHNCYFLLYAPKYREYLEDKFNEGILDQFVFLHHPLYAPTISNKYKSKELVIGIYGQAVNQNAYDIINCFNKKYDTGNVRFKVMAKEDDLILKVRNVDRLFEQNYVSNEELEKVRKKFDYIMIPYDHNQYKVTASGILCDAISEEIPVLMLDSPLLDYYNQYGIGILEKSVEEMAARIAGLSLNNDDCNKYREAEHRLKSIVLQENIKIFRELIGSA